MIFFRAIFKNLIYVAITNRYDYDAEMAKYMNSDMCTQSHTQHRLHSNRPFPIQGTVVFPPALQGLIVD